MIKGSDKMLKILLVEDDEKLCYKIKDTLVKWGFRVIIVESFDSVQNTYIEYKPHLVIMDIGLPCYDGIG